MSIGVELLLPAAALVALVVLTIAIIAATEDPTSKSDGSDKMNGGAKNDELDIPSLAVLLRNAQRDAGCDMADCLARVFRWLIHWAQRGNAAGRRGKTTDPDTIGETTATHAPTHRIAA